MLKNYSGHFNAKKWSFYFAIMRTFYSAIDNDALKRIFEYTRGIPRQINRLCTTALISGRIDTKSKHWATVPSAKPLPRSTWPDHPFN
jgi:hypothetical protein